MTATTTKQKPGARVYAKAAASVLGPHALSAGLTFSAYLVFAWVITSALRHTAGVGIPWFGLAILTYFGTGLLRMVAEHFGKAWAKGATAGKHEAELAQTQAALKAALANPDLLAGLLGKGSSGDKQAPSFGNYL